MQKGYSEMAVSYTHLGSSIKIETLEKTWQTIVSGIDETRQIQENARKQRIDDQKRLEAIKSDFNTRYSVPDKK